MLSEACATRAPVQVFDAGEVHGRVRRFVDALLARGRAQRLGASWPVADCEPLRETARIAAEIRARLALS
jgi:mitochondrial fission protein ELM1